MSGTWNAHYAMVQGLIDDQKAKRAQRAAAAQAARAAAVPTGGGSAPGMGWGVPGDAVEPWQGGMNQGGFGAPEGPPGDLGKLFGDISPGTIGGLLGGLGGGLALGPLGGLIGGLAGRGIAGLLGSQAPQPTAQPTAPGIGSLGGESFGGGAGAGTFGGGLGDIGAAGMGLGLGDLGAMTGNEIMGWQGGGYTGAGRDGRVQPNRPAGIVHEGELVIPHHVLRSWLR